MKNASNKTTINKLSRFSFFAICVIALLALSACNKKDNIATSRTTTSQNDVESILQQRMAEEDASKAANAAQVAVAPTQNNAQNETSVAPVVTAPTQSDTSSIASSAQSASNNAAVPVSAPQNSNNALSSSTSTTVTAKNAFGKIISAQNTAARIKPEHPAAKSVSVDVDLTALSSTMVYSEVLNIMTAPETYIGKTLKMNGIFSYYYDENTNKYYFGCIIQDATACCAQGIEFILTDDYIYPDDYPTEGDIVTVAGEFMTYEEDGFTYFTLKDSKLLV